MFKPEEHPQAFIGRIKESKQLGRLLQESSEQGAKLVLIGGDAGIGKTALLQQLQENTRVNGGQYLVCKSGPLGSAYPYHPLAEILRCLIDVVSTGSIKDVLAGYSPRILAELSLLVPKLANLITSNIRSGQFSGTLPEKWFLENACTIIRDLLPAVPLVLIIEDIPYADPTSLEVIQYFIQHSEEFRILICGTYDLDDIDLVGVKNSPFRNFVRSLAYEENVSKIYLSPLSREETEELISASINLEMLPSGLGETVYEKSEGNPLVIRHLIEKLIETEYLKQTGKVWQFVCPAEISLPQEIQEFYAAKLESINPEVRNVLSMAAVIGRRFNPGILANILGKSLVDILPALEESIKLKLIEEHHDVDTGHFSFHSSRFQEVLYESISYQRKILLHEEIGRLLEKQTEYAVSPDELAYHFQWGADKVKAIKYYVMAGKRALSLYAFHSAWRYFSNAKDLFPLVDQQALEEFKYPVLEGLAEAASFLGYYPDAWRCLGLLLNGGILNDTKKYVSVQSKMGFLCFRMGDFSGALEHYNLALKHGGNREKYFTINAILYTYLELGRFEEAETLAQLQLARAEAINNSALIYEIYAVFTLLHIYTGEVNKAQQFAAKIAGLDASNALANLFFNLTMGLLASEAGSLAQALEHLQHGLRIAKQMQDPLLSGQMQILLGRIYLMQGRPERSWELLERIKLLEVYEHSIILKRQVTYLKGLLLLADKSQLTKHKCDFSQGTWENGHVIGAWMMSLRAEVALLTGIGEKYQAFLKDAEKIYATVPTPRNKVHLLRVMMADNLSRGNNGEALRIKEQIMQACTENHMNLEGYLTCMTWPDADEDRFAQEFARRLKVNCDWAKHGQGGREILPKGEHMPAEVGLVLEYIHCQFAGDLSMDTLCKVASLSERQLRRLFNQYTGQSIKEYVSSYRIDKAKELLKNPTLGVSRVGELVGLSDKSHFCKAFKSLVGVNPTEYRRKQSALTEIANS